jgi:riboflavin synthase
VDGVSLTVNEIEGTTFTVSIIPHTAEHATIGKKRIGERVNIETDLIGKYVERFLQEAALLPKENGRQSTLDADFLKKHGFT